MIPLTESIERLKAKNKSTYKEGDMDELRMLISLQKEQSAKGGPVKTHHEIKGRKV